MDRSIQPIPGTDVRLTIHSGLQRTMERSMMEKKGSVLVSNAKTGDILAFVNSPLLSPELFSCGISHEEWKNIIAKCKEKIREYDRKYSLENKDKKKAYRLRNREHSRQWQREYYQKNKQAIKIRRYHQDELRVGAEAKIDGGTASKAITMVLPNL